MRLLVVEEKTISQANDIEALKAKIRQCDVCVHAVKPLPVTPNPIVRGTAKSKIRIISQAPGNLAHQSSKPFYDPSGVRLRAWLGVDEATFYNEDNFLITPMGFCFPGYDKHGGDLPPRKECAPLWQDELTTHLTGTRLTLLVGMYAVRNYLGKDAKQNLTETVRDWREYGPDIMPLPHPSWRNNVWIKKHDWFQEELIALKTRIAELLS